MDQQHTGPGRRFAAGSTRADQLLGAFGFVSHALFFTALGVGLGICPWFEPESRRLLFWSLLIAATVCTIGRAAQVGASTTVESLRAIKAAWWK